MQFYKFRLCDKLHYVETQFHFIFYHKHSSSGTAFVSCTMHNQSSQVFSINVTKLWRSTEAKLTDCCAHTTDKYKNVYLLNKTCPAEKNVLRHLALLAQQNPFTWKYGNAASVHVIHRRHPFRKLGLPRESPASRRQFLANKKFRVNATSISLNKHRSIFEGSFRPWEELEMPPTRDMCSTPRSISSQPTDDISILSKVRASVGLRWPTRILDQIQRRSVGAANSFRSLIVCLELASHSFGNQYRNNWNTLECPST